MSAWLCHQDGAEQALSHWAEAKDPGLPKLLLGPNNYALHNHIVIHCLLSYGGVQPLGTELEGVRTTTDVTCLNNFPAIVPGELLTTVENLYF